MRKSIKRTVFIRVAAALLSILLFSGVTTFNLLRVQGMQEENVRTEAVLSRAQAAEAAHYRWALTQVRPGPVDLRRGRHGGRDHSEPAQRDSALT